MSEPTAWEVGDGERAAASPRSSVSRQVLVGELCPRAAAGRPAVLPLLVHGRRWKSGSRDVVHPVASRSARQFTVLAWDGRRVGLFSVVGAANVGLHHPAAVGAYAGASPCSLPGRDGARVDDDECMAAQRNCGVALSVLEPGSGLQARPFAEDPEPARFMVSGACALADRLVLDIDQDGRLEAYALGDFVDARFEPGQTLFAVTPRPSQCERRFAIYQLVAPQPSRQFAGMDLVGVIDLDDDGRFDLVTVYRRRGERQWAIYSARSSAGRLELVGGATSWPNL